jgi:hypothetical protein
MKTKVTIRVHGETHKLLVPPEATFTDVFRYLDDRMNVQTGTTDLAMMTFTVPLTVPIGRFVAIAGKELSIDVVPIQHPEMSDDPDDHPLGISLIEEVV